MASTKPPYPAEFRQQMVELARADRGLKQLSRELGVSANAIRNGSNRTPAVLRPCPARAAAMRRRCRRASTTNCRSCVASLRQVQMERDILAKATAWFAGKSERTSTTSSNS